MILAYRFFALPIHKGTADAYYGSHRKYVEEEKKKIEAQWQRPWKDIPRDVQTRWEISWFCPPWFFNEIVGFLDIGMDRGNCVTANIYLKRKYFPKSRNPRADSGPGTTLENQSFLYYVEVPKRMILDLKDNGSFVNEIEGIIRDAQEIIAQLKRRPRYQIWNFPFSWEHINFVKALPEIKTRAEDV